MFRGPEPIPRTCALTSELLMFVYMDSRYVHHCLISSKHAFAFIPRSRGTQSLDLGGGRPDPSSGVKAGVTTPRWSIV